MSNVTTPRFRVSYPKVLKAERNKLSGKDEFSVVALFPFGKDSPEFAKMRAACNEAIEKKFGKDKTQWPKNLKSPFRDQGERVKYVEGKKILPAGHVEGNIFINLKSTQKPGVVEKTESGLQEIVSEADFYGGCWAVASVRAYAYDQAGNRGVSFGLQNICKVKDDEPLGGGKTRPEDDFAAVQFEGDTSSGDADPFN